MLKPAKWPVWVVLRGFIAGACFFGKTPEGDEDADILVIGWGGTYGAIKEAVNHTRRKGYKIAQSHFRYINPFPKNTEELGYLFQCKALFQFNIVRGLPFRVGDIENKIVEVLGGKNE